MKTWGLRIGFALAVAFLALTVVNASWLAPVPQGTAKLIAHRGAGAVAIPGDGDCSATRIEPPYHDHIENTSAGIRRAIGMGSKMAEIDIGATKDGRIAVFRDASLDCRTDGAGPLREKTMAELKALDVGYGYTADGGKTFPLRGLGRGLMPDLVELVPQLPIYTELVYHFRSDNPREATALIAALEASGRDVEGEGDAFYGPPAPVAEMAKRYPKAWTWTQASAEQCSSDYVLYGWTGIFPASCENGTMIVPLDQQWKYWGFPNRLIARMEAHGGRIIVVGPGVGDGGMPGLTLPEQLGEIPSSFNGYIWVDDAWTIAPSYKPLLDKRTEREREAAADAISRRRERG